MGSSWAGRENAGASFLPVEVDSAGCIPPRAVESALGPFVKHLDPIRLLCDQKEIDWWCNLQYKRRRKGCRRQNRCSANIGPQPFHLGRIQKENDSMKKSKLFDAKFDFEHEERLFNQSYLGL